MAISRPQQRILVLTALATTAVQTSEVYALHSGVTSFTLSWNFTEAATLDVQFQGTDGNFYTFDTQAAVANTADVVTYFGRPGNGTIRVRTTPGAQPITGFIEATYGGYSGSAG